MTYILLAAFICVFLVSHVRLLLKAAQSRNVLDILIAVLFLLFFIFFALGLIWGGSAYHEAMSDYAFYQTGHYYLVSHGNYTEVTQLQYCIMRIAEPVGIVSFVVGFVLSIIKDKKEKQMQNKEG